MMWRYILRIIYNRPVRSANRKLHVFCLFLCHECRGHSDGSPTGASSLIRGCIACPVSVYLSFRGIIWGQWVKHLLIIDFCTVVEYSFVGSDLSVQEGETVVIEVRRNDTDQEGAVGLLHFQTIVRHYWWPQGVDIWWLPWPADQDVIMALKN